MHELTLCQNILKTIKATALTHQKQRVHSITLEIGDAFMVDTDALKFWFPIVSKNTLAEGAKLNMIQATGTDMMIKSMEAE